MSLSSTVPGPQPLSMSWQEVAGLIDHTLLDPDATRDQITRACEEAITCGFATVFVHQAWTALAASITLGTKVKVGVPVGFPHGMSFTSVKRFESQEAIKCGAAEIDMVMNIGALRSGDRDTVSADIRGVVEIVHGHGGLLKVILETSLLTLDEKLVSCQIVVSEGADFVKTSTGLLGGATVEDVALLRGVVGDALGVKASGGIRSATDALRMIHAGATRIGTSSGLSILREMGAQVPNNVEHPSTY